MKKVVVCFAALMISLCYAGIEKKYLSNCKFERVCNL